MQAEDSRQVRTSRFSSGIFYFGATLLLALVVHLTQDRIGGLVDSIPILANSKFLQPKSEMMLEYVPSMKGMVFLFSVLVLSVPLVKDLRQNPRPSRLRGAFTPFIPVITVILLGILVFQPGSRSLGAEYARIARDPFDQHSGIFNTRLLMPALAHILFFRGNWLYYAFSMLLTTGFLAQLYSWFEEHCPLPFWQFLSLGTCSFVIFQYQNAGYPDILVFFFFLLVMRKNSSQETKLSALLLALIAHESSVFLGVVLAWRYLERRNFIIYLISVAAYTLVWFGVTGFHPHTIFSSREVAGESSIVWLMRSPALEFLGIFAAFKALWILLIAGIFLALSRRRFTEASLIVAALAAGIVMSVLAVDTSRLMGFAFPGLLAAVVVIKQTLAEKSANRLIAIVFLLNLIIPSVYVGSNIGVEWSPGLYSILYQWLPP
jgi:hypothetical protein